MGRQLTNAASRTEDDTGLARLRRGLGQARHPPYPPTAPSAAVRRPIHPPHRAQ